MERSERLNKKGVLLIGLAIIFLGVLCYNYVTDYSSLTTDSGFDVDYGGGGFSGDFSSGSSYSGGSMSTGFFIYFFTMLAAMVLITNWFSKSVKYHKYKNIVELVLLFVIIGLPLMPTSFIPILFVFAISLFVTHYLERTSRSVNARLREECYAKLTPEERALLDECYRIFYDVQKSWMEFDYDKLRELVTDELFNQYQNQLKQLELKGEKNIMEDFELIEAGIYHQETKDGYEEICVDMTVLFYDYIANNKGRIVRGNGNIKVRMNYELTFVRDIKAIHNCPNCNAELKEGQTICEYCHTHIHSVTGKLKLANKKDLNQP